ncbi:MAG: hypothetical protein R3F31_02240 [Verrucomicrobiales bacterium]
MSPGVGNPQSFEQLQQEIDDGHRFVVCQIDAAVGPVVPEGLEEDVCQIVDIDQVTQDRRSAADEKGQFAGARCGDNAGKDHAVSGAEHCTGAKDQPGPFVFCHQCFRPPFGFGIQIDGPAGTGSGLGEVQLVGILIVDTGGGEVNQSGPASAPAVIDDLTGGLHVVVS